MKFDPIRDDLARYRRDGFLLVRGLFGEAQRREIAADLDAVFRLRAGSLGLAPPSAEDQDGFGELIASLFRADVAAYIAAAKLTQHLASVHRLGVGAEVMGLLRGLGIDLPAISTRPVIHYMADRLKIPGGYQKTPTHQDWRSVQGSLDGVTIWSPLYDVGLDDYPLEVVPGSHVHGLLPSVPDAPNYRIPEDHYRETEFRPLAMRAGDAVIFSGFLVHRTGVRGGERVRVSLSYRFNNVAEPSFVRRNYPNPYLYRPDPEIVTPGFAAAEDVAEVFGEPVA